MLLTSKEDMKWLYDTHLKGKKEKGHSAIIRGNEDCPTKIIIYNTKNPQISDKPIQIWKLKSPDNNGKFEYIDITYNEDFWNDE